MCFCDILNIQKLSRTEHYLIKTLEQQILTLTLWEPQSHQYSTGFAPRIVLLMELGTVARETSLKDNVVAQSSRIQTDPIIWARQTEMYEYLRGSLSIIFNTYK